MEEETQEYLDGKADTPADDEMLQDEQADDKTSSKQEKFKELATKRTNDICHRIQQLGKLANRNAYAYDDQQVNLIFSTIEEQLRLAKGKFQEAGECRNPSLPYNENRGIPDEKTLAAFRRSHHWPRQHCRFHILAALPDVQCAGKG